MLLDAGKKGKCIKNNKKRGVCKGAAGALIYIWQAGRQTVRKVRHLRLLSDSPQLNGPRRTMSCSHTDLNCCGFYRQVPATERVRSISGSNHGSLCAD